MPRAFCVDQANLVRTRSVAFAFFVITAPLWIFSNQKPVNETGNSRFENLSVEHTKIASQRNSKPINIPLANPHIIVLKSKRRLELFDGKSLLRTYRIGLGFSPVGNKVKEGDGRTPEGEFYVCVRNENSKFFLSLGLSYPGPKDARRGLRQGLITREQYDQITEAYKHRQRPPWDTPLGGEIFIHGNGGQCDWTWGCMALEDKEMKELFDAVPIGTRVEIFR